MNYASEDQLTAVGQSCKYFEPRVKAFTASVITTSAENISCEVCKHWNGIQCTIDMFDKVLTSLDQT